MVNCESTVGRIGSRFSVIYGYYSVGFGGFVEEGED